MKIRRLVSSKYTRSKVRKAMPREYAYIIDEMLHTHYEDNDKRDYYENIISTIIDTGRASNFLVQLCELIKRLAVDHLHVVGDIFDRGPRADIILDSLLDYHSVDIQWGNHDVLWMGAASGSRTLVATVLANSLRYNNLEVIETGYGISLRPLSVFANEVYRDTDVSRFSVKLTGEEAERYTEKDKLLSARMYKAITMILFKLEGQKILRNPDFGMADRLLLDKIDYESRTVTVDGRAYPMLDTDFPTVNPADPYALTPEEEILIHQLTLSFLHSEKLQRHVRFLYSKGSLYQDLQRQPALPRLHPHGGRRLPPLLPGERGASLRQGLSGLCGSGRPPGLLLRPRLGGAGRRHGLPVVPVGGPQQPHLRPRPHDHL